MTFLFHQDFAGGYVKGRIRKSLKGQGAYSRFGRLHFKGVDVTFTFRKGASNPADDALWGARPHQVLNILCNDERAGMQGMTVFPHPYDHHIRSMAATTQIIVHATVFGVIKRERQ